MLDSKNTILENIPYLRRYARALLGNAIMADKLVQHTLNCALDLIHVLQANAEIKCWLFSVFHNLYCDYIKGDLNDTGRYRDIPYDDLPENNLNKDLLSALEKLSMEQKEILLLVSLEGFQYDEACYILNQPLGALLSDLHGARNTISQHLFKENQTPEHAGLGCA